MMHKAKREFYLVERRGKRKVPVFYYRVFGDDWTPIGEWSTGKTTRHEAMIHCTRLMDAGKLIPAKGRKATVHNPSRFREYFADWYDWPRGGEPRCPYIRKKLKQGRTYSQTTATNQRGILRKYLLPFFGDRHKGRITEEQRNPKGSNTGTSPGSPSGNGQ